MLKCDPLINKVSPESWLLYDPDKVQIHVLLCLEQTETGSPNWKHHIIGLKKESTLLLGL